MTVSYSVAVRNAQLDAVESTIGTSAVLILWNGAMPAGTANANVGTAVATMNLPSDWMNNAANGTKAKAGTWNDSSADASATVNYFRIYDSTATTCGMQGTVTISGGGGDMTLDNNVVASGQSITITTFTITAGNP